MQAKGSPAGGNTNPHPSDGPEGSDLEVQCRKLQNDYDVLHRILDLLGHVTEKETVDDICRTIVEGVRDELQFDRAGLHLWHAEEGNFRGTFGTDEDGKTRDEHDLWWKGEGWPPWEEVKKGNTFIEDQLDQPPPKPGEEGIKAHLVVLRFGERIYGILSVDNRISRRPVSEDELKYLALFSRIVGNAVDISRANTALTRSEERFRQIADNSREWIWETNAEGRYTYSSPVVQGILGYTPEEVVGQNFIEFTTDSAKEKSKATFDTAVSEKLPIQRSVNLQLHKDGQETVLETSGLPILDATGQVVGYRGVHRDVTTQVRMEEQLRQAQKMEAVGRLAGGIAHYFNNLLTMIMGCSTMLIDELGEGSDIRADIEQIRDAGEQAAALTRQLLALSKRQVLNIQRLNVNDSLGDIEDFLRHTLGGGIDLVINLDPNVRDVAIDEDRLKYVLLHLVINARSAMAETAEKMKLSMVGGGDMEWTVTPPGQLRQLVIETRGVSLDASECLNRPHMKPGEYVVLSICDTGVGMPEEVREHLFEPFFTTKEVGEGTGLSLSTIYGTMTQMGGDIRVESELGKGTTFELYMPVHGLAAEIATAPAQAKPAFGSKIILLVEDEEAVRDFTVHMLKKLGYVVLSASDGAEALELLQEAPEQRIDLVVTDMVMPRMSGKEFVQALRKTRQDIRILFVSGYTVDETVDGDIIGEDVAFLQKPYTGDILAAKVAEALTG